MILLLLISLLTSQTPGARVTLRTVDIVERQFTAVGQRVPFVGVFSTRYAYHGHPVDAATFWYAISPGTVLDIKIRRYEAFSVLVASQINVP